MKYLVFNADDYGLSPAVSAGILAASQGVVRSTTVMANLVTEADLRLLGASELGAGVHLNLSCGPPLTPDYPRELLNAHGGFDKQLAHEPATWDNPARHKAVLAEWQAQINRLNQGGLRLDHADSHHHLHLLPQLLPLALALAQEHRLPLRTSTLVQRAAAATAAVPTADDLVLDFFGNNCIGRASLLAALGRARGAVVEVMCHPGRVDELLRQRSGYRAEREQELATLGDPGLAVELERIGWQITDYGVCLRR